MAQQQPDEQSQFKIIFDRKEAGMKVLNAMEDLSDSWIKIIAALMDLPDSPRSRRSRVLFFWKTKYPKTLLKR